MLGLLFQLINNFYVCKKKKMITLGVVYVKTVLLLSERSDQNVHETNTFFTFLFRFCPTGFPTANQRQLATGSSNCGTASSSEPCCIECFGLTYCDVLNGYKVPSEDSVTLLRPSTVSSSPSEARLHPALSPFRTISVGIPPGESRVRNIYNIFKCALEAMK